MTGWIRGIGWVDAAGCGNGRSSVIAPAWGGNVPIPSRKDIFDQPDMRFGRLDDFSRVGLAAITYCLRDAEREQWQQKRPIGMIAATHRGCLATDLTYLQSMLAEGGKLASPNLFAYTLPNCFLGEAALRFGLVGNSLIINQSTGDDLEMIRYALQELNWSDQQGVLAGFCNVPPEGYGETAGALFLLIDSAGDGDGDATGYGRLDDDGERLLLNGKVVTDINALVAACLAGC